MIKARRIRHVCFSTPDPAGQADYYGSIIGLGVVARDSDQLFLATESEQLAVILEAGTEPVCKRIAFEVAPDIDPADLSTDLAASGIKSDVRSDSAPGISRSVVFADAEGTEIELISGWNASPATEPGRGIAANRLGHIAMYTPIPCAPRNSIPKCSAFGSPTGSNSPLSSCDAAPIIIRSTSCKARAGA